MSRMDFDRLAKAQRGFAASPRRLVGHVPTIAITPVADGRTGAYEDNQAKTWAMVERVCNPTTENAKLPDGTPVRVVTAPGIVYGALVALAQHDIKRLIAYSSVSHLGFCMLGLLTLNRLGVQGGTLQMINHGLSTGGLFACVGMLYERYHTREIDKFGGLAYKMPVLAFFMLVFTLSSIGLPGLNGFVGEFLVQIGRAHV